MTIEEAAKRLGLSPQTLRVQYQRGRLRAKRIGSGSRAPLWVTPAEVERYRRESLGQPPHRPMGAKDRKPRARATASAAPDPS